MEIAALAPGPCRLLLASYPLSIFSECGYSCQRWVSVNVVCSLVTVLKPLMTLTRSSSSAYCKEIIKRKKTKLKQLWGTSSAYKMDSYSFTSFFPKWFWNSLTKLSALLLLSMFFPSSHHKQRTKSNVVLTPLNIFIPKNGQNEQYLMLISSYSL